MNWYEYAKDYFLCSQSLIQISIVVQRSKGFFITMTMGAVLNQSHIHRPTAVKNNYCTKCILICHLK